MPRKLTTTLALSAAILVAMPVLAQQAADDDSDDKQAKTTFGSENMQFYRNRDLRGHGVFEPSKFKSQPEYKGLNLDFGLELTTRLQWMDHSNEAIGAKPLINITPGSGISLPFDLPTANLVFGSQFAEGVRCQLEIFASSRHHNETWVEGGYCQFDNYLIDNSFLNLAGMFTRVKAGMMSVNYGDAWFRRTDNGNSTHNLFIGNMITDTGGVEPMVEFYTFLPNLVFVAGIGNGENNPKVIDRANSSLSLLGKVAYDRRYSDDLRFRLSLSRYQNESGKNTLAGDNHRTGSSFALVMEPDGSSPSSQFRSGWVNPNMRRDLGMTQFNMFFQCNRFETFGVIERLTGRAKSGEAENRAWNQRSIETLYHFPLPSSQKGVDVGGYIGARYNTVSGNLDALNPDVNVDRWEVVGGMNLTNHLLAKLAYVSQKYNGFAVSDIRYKGRFSGITLETSASW